MIDLPADELHLVQKILASHVPDCEVFAFGSRVSGKAKPYSDLDILIRGSARLPLLRIAELREAFEESSLPIRVDIIDWFSLSESSRLAIQQTLFPLQIPNSNL